MRMEAIRLAMFDMAGTTVNDIVDGLPLVVGATQRAFARHGVDLDPHLIHAQRGKEKREMISALLQESGQPLAMLEPVYASFLSELERGLLAVSEMPGTEETFRFLRRRGVAVAVGSGFPPDVTARIIAHLGWRARGLIDYATTAEEAGGGRPAPNMIHAAMAALGVDDPRHVLKVGDTMMDILEGKSAGAWTVAVLTGSQTRDQLASVSPDEIVQSVADVPSLFARDSQIASLEDAIALAISAHRGQQDKVGQPYILHPLRVMLRCDTETARIVAVLHDVVEDTPHTLAELRALGYADEVLQALDCLTRYVGEPYEAFIARVSGNALARRVKLADLADNMDICRLPNLSTDDVERLRRYQRAWRELSGETEAG